MSDSPNLSDGRKARRRDASQSNGVSLTYKHSFGVTGPLRSNVLFVRSPDDFSKEKEVLLYPVGQKVALYAAEENRLKYLNCDKRNANAVSILAIAESPNRKFIAVCEKCGPKDGAQVSVYYISTCNRIRTMIYPSKGDFHSCCLSGDSKVRLTVTRETRSEEEEEEWCIFAFCLASLPPSLPQAALESPTNNYAPLSVPFYSVRMYRCS